MICIELKDLPDMYYRSFFFLSVWIFLTKRNRFFFPFFFFKNRAPTPRKKAQHAL